MTGWKWRYVIAMTSEMDTDRALMPLACRAGEGRNPPRIAIFDTEGEAQNWLDRGEEIDTGEPYFWKVVMYQGKSQKLGVDNGR